jgi:hypothetical protein
VNGFFGKILEFEGGVDRELKVVLLWRLAKFMGRGNVGFGGVDKEGFSKLVGKLTEGVAGKEFYLFTEFEKMILQQISLFSKKNLQKDAKKAFKR